MICEYHFIQKIYLYVVILIHFWKSLHQYYHYSDHEHAHRNLSLDHYNNDESQYNHDVSNIKLFLLDQFISKNILLLSVLVSCHHYSDKRYDLSDPELSKLKCSFSPI